MAVGEMHCQNPSIIRILEKLQNESLKSLPKNLKEQTLQFRAVLGNVESIATNIHAKDTLHSVLLPHVPNLHGVVPSASENGMLVFDFQ